MSGSRINPVAWIAWLIAAGAIPLISRHPLHLILSLLVVMVVHLSVPSRHGTGKTWKLFAYVGSSVAILSIGFNVLTVHSGDRSFATLPESLPIIGGRLTYNALVYGVASALAISTVLFAAATFNTVVRHAVLISKLPGPFQRLGVAGTIALNFVPQTVRAGQDIYDVQRARGRQMRSVGDARAFLVPLLGNGLERAVQMSEALETRGYGRQPVSDEQSNKMRWRILLLFAGAVASLPLIATGRLWETLILVATIVIIFGITGSRRSLSIHTTDWNVSSAVITATSSAALMIVGTTMATSDALTYTPFPRLSWPQFDILTGVALCLLLSPVIFAADVDQ